MITAASVLHFHVWVRLRTNMRIILYAKIRDKKAVSYFLATIVSQYDLNKN